MIKRNSNGLEAMLAFSVIDENGQPVIGHVWNDLGLGSTDEFQIWKPGSGAFVNTDLNRITEMGAGDYYYECDSTETDSVGKIFYKTNLFTGMNAYESNRVRWDEVWESFQDGEITRSKFDQDALYMFRSIRREAIQAYTSNTITLDAGASSISGLYNGYELQLVDGTGTGQTKTIIAYNGTTKVATLDSNWLVNPSVVTTKYEIFAKIDNSSPSVNALAVINSVLESGHTLGDMIRLLVSLNGCKVSDYTSGTYTFKSIDGSKTRWTVTANATGRTSNTPGDLT